MKILSKIFTLILTLLILWCLVSTVEVTAKNSKPNPQYSSANVWVLLFSDKGGTN